MFFFAWSNAGVRFDGFGALSVVVVVCLLLGKVCGIMGFAYLAVKLGFPLPVGMGARHVFTMAACAALGLTVALFVAGEAFSDGNLQAQAKMGALLSLAVAPLALSAGKCLRVRDRHDNNKGIRKKSPHQHGSATTRKKSHDRKCHKDGRVSLVEQAQSGKITAAATSEEGELGWKELIDQADDDHRAVAKLRC